MKLIPIEEFLTANTLFEKEPACKEILFMTIEYYKVIGFAIPWIGYFVSEGNAWVGSAGYKGRPVNGRIEIAYGTFPEFQQKGVGTEICRLLVQLALTTDPTLRVCARTLPEENYSTRILTKNGFQLLGEIMDEEDGKVWEWEYNK